MSPISTWSNESVQQVLSVAAGRDVTQRFQKLDQVGFFRFA
jgi:hypothetical protein